MSEHWKKDRVYLVTGAFGQLGSAVARRALAHGARVALVDYAAEGPDLGPKSLNLGGHDLTTEAGATEAVARVVEAFGQVDAVVNAAGGFTMETLEDGGLDAWDRMFAINLRTAVATSRAALSALKRGGTLVNLGAASAAGRAGAMLGPYTASKAAVAKLTESLAAEVKERGIRVNAVLPTILDTPANREAMPDADVDDWVDVDALADVILFLSGPGSRAVTGALIEVRGGL